MNIYLDIDGVLIHSGKPAKHLDEFIAYIDENYRDSVYWLTTHCQGNTEPVMTYLERFITNKDTLSKMSKFKPTKWSTAKTEGIDFTQSFLWFDDTLLYGEKAILAEYKMSENVIVVDLNKNPDSLKMFVQDFPLPM